MIKLPPRQLLIHHWRLVQMQRSKRNPQNFWSGIKTIDSYVCVSEDAGGLIVSASAPTVGLSFSGLCWGKKSLNHIVDSLD